MISRGPGARPVAAARAGTIRTRTAGAATAAGRRYSGLLELSGEPLTVAAGGGGGGCCNGENPGSPTNGFGGAGDTGAGGGTGQPGSDGGGQGGGGGTSSGGGEGGTGAANGGPGSAGNGGPGQSLAGGQGGANPDGGGSGGGGGGGYFGGGGGGGGADAGGGGGGGGSSYGVGSGLTNEQTASGAAEVVISYTPPSLSISTTQQPASATVGSSISDQATVSGGNSPTGTVTFNLYNNSSGTGTPLFTDADVALSGGVATSAGYTATAPGTDYWVATYNGDSNNSSVTSGTALEPVTITPAPPSIDAQGSGQAITAATARLSTPTAGDLLVAFVASDSSSAGGQTSAVSGGGLSWTLQGRENKNLGDAEIWTARAAGALSNTTITATVKKAGWDETITVIAFKNAPGPGNVATFTSMKGAPTGSLTTTQPNSWVFAVGDDWLKSTPRTVGAGQTLLHQATDSVGDTYWVQSTTAPTPTQGTKVNINDTAPTTDPYNFVLIEIL